MYTSLLPFCCLFFRGCHRRRRRSTRVLPFSHPQFSYFIFKLLVALFVLLLLHHSSHLSYTLQLIQIFFLSYSRSCSLTPLLFVTPSFCFLSPPVPFSPSLSPLYHKQASIPEIRTASASVLTLRTTSFWYGGFYFTKSAGGLTSLPAAPLFPSTKAKVPVMPLQTVAVMPGNLKITPTSTTTRQHRCSVRPSRLHPPVRPPGAACIGTPAPVRRAHRRRPGRCTVVQALADGNAHQPTPHRHHQSRRR